MSQTKTRRELLTSGGADPLTDTEWLERMLSVELLLLFAYEHVLGSAILAPVARRQLAPVLAHEHEHVAALRGRISARGGRAPSPPPSVAAADRYLARRQVSGRLGHLQGALDALFLLRAVERVTIGVYFVALRELRDPRLILLTTQIMASDSQHEAVIGQLIYPDDLPNSVPYGLIQGRQ